MSLPSKRPQSPAEGEFLFELDPEPLEEATTAYGGIPVFLRALRSLDVGGRANRHLQLKQRQRGFDGGSYMESFALVQTDGNYQVQDDVSKVVGNHSFKFGGQYLLQTVKLLPDFTANGQFQFSGYQTGSDFADFLLGFPNLYSQGFSPAFYERSNYAGIFAQDSWRVTSNLTLNYGVRWDLIMPWTEEHNQTGTLILGEQSQVFPTAPTGYVFPGDPCEVIL